MRYYFLIMGCLSIFYYLILVFYSRRLRSTFAAFWLLSGGVHLLFGCAPFPVYVFSFMPGTVEDIKVKEGDSVRQGDVLIIFRAMKMNNKILSPIDGKVKSINVKKGDNIPKNALMVTVA